MHRLRLIPLNNSMFQSFHFREILALTVVLYFGYAFYHSPSDPLIVGALIANFSNATGFYLGGSKTGADTASQNATTLAMAARSTEPQPVQVDPK